MGHSIPASNIKNTMLDQVKRMDESVERNILDVTGATSNTAAASSILGVIKRFIGGFVLTDEEKAQAGIDIDNFHETHDARQASRLPKTSETIQAKGRIG